MRSIKINVLGASLLMLLVIVSAMGQQAELVSVTRFGNAGGSKQSSAARLSANGRFVAFQSTSNKLVRDDTNGYLQDIFVRDVVSNKTTLVSVNRTGTGSGNKESSIPAISANGRFVVFISAADDLVMNDTNDKADVFVRDIVQGTTTMVSVNSAGTDGGNNGAHIYDWPVNMISADGRFVLFNSMSYDLVANDINGSTQDVFVRDLVAGTTTLVSVNRDGTGSGNGHSGFSVLSANGRFVAFEGLASNLVANDFNNAHDIFLRDLVAGTTTLVSPNSAGTGTGNNHSYFNGPPVMSPNGRFVCFNSTASDLVTNDTNGAVPDGFIRDVVAGKTTLISVNHDGTGSGNQSSGTGWMSGNGRIIVFQSAASDLVTNDTNGMVVDVFVRDLTTKTTTLLSLNSAGTGSGNSFSFEPKISFNGRFIVFTSRASNLVTNDTNGKVYDVFVHDLATRTTRLGSLNSAGTGSARGPSFSPLISADGRMVVFQSQAPDLTTNDRSYNLDIFAISTLP